MKVKLHIKSDLYRYTPFSAVNYKERAYEQALFRAPAVHSSYGSRHLLTLAASDRMSDAAGS